MQALLHPYVNHRSQAYIAHRQPVSQTDKICPNSIGLLGVFIVCWSVMGQAISKLPGASFSNKGLSVHMISKVSIYSHANEAHFRVHGFAPGLTLMKRLETTWK